MPTSIRDGFDDRKVRCTRDLSEQTFPFDAGGGGSRRRAFRRNGGLAAEFFLSSSFYRISCIFATINRYVALHDSVVIQDAVARRHNIDDAAYVTSSGRSGALECQIRKIFIRRDFAPKKNLKEAFGPLVARVYFTRSSCSFLLV